MFLFSLSPFDVVLCVVLHPYFLFLIVAFFSHAGLYSFSFPKDFSFLSLVICCTAWPRSIWWSNVAKLWVDWGLHHCPDPDCICNHLELTTRLNWWKRLWKYGSLEPWQGILIYMCMHVDVWVHSKCLSTCSISSADWVLLWDLQQLTANGNGSAKLIRILGLTLERGICLLLRNVWCP